MKVVVGLSGGVDSSVAAYLLKQQGCDVLGVFMQNWEDDNNDQYCSIKEDSIDAIAVADKLGIDIDIVNFAKEYKKNVFEYFLQEYANYRTPNPDIFCNSEIKFKCFLEHAISLGAEYIATGHYVGKICRGNQQFLSKAIDHNKDQSYFLYRLNQSQIKHSMFPLSNITKPQVREIARKLDLVTANKKDSTGICFIGERPFREFLQNYFVNNEGPIIDTNCRVLGTHLGLNFYTIGQRKGLGIGGNGEPWFVANKDVKNNALIVVQGHNHPLLYTDFLYANQLSFADGVVPQQGEYTVKTRYRMKDVPCTLQLVNDDNIKIIFNSPQWAVTPGQSVVLYNEQVCLGGGIIK